ncbi:MAG: hypothetical protein HN742_14750 [Lentisphaerae bacterium]|jgi:hypothetical protein|nr:hypothetical protein [Lentisphaerota bacterium]MBT4818921.1 hypothetical protein [Lentisphaerota bacterium]MBT5612939.1 hypothetical protein [Lentisphaerota bacterium]MBT7053596.1 hypothetical protein [Lentisphaerota bacterium]MBT7843136.1 hypothetical protein [Lentisphaerota bacterium]
MLRRSTPGFAAMLGGAFVGLLCLASGGPVGRRLGDRVGPKPGEMQRVPSKAVQASPAIPWDDIFSPAPYPSHGYPWENNDLGITDAVPEPWAPVELAGNRIRLAGKVYELQQSGFPAQVSLSGCGVFAVTPEIALQINGRKVAFRDIKTEVAERKASAVVLSGAHSDRDYVVRFTVTIEFDGLYRARLDISPNGGKPVSIDRFQLVFPIRRELASYYSRFIAYDFDAMRADRSDLLASYGRIESPLSLSFVPTLWVGNDKMGLEWVCESDIAWQNKEPGTQLQLQPQQDRVLLTANVIDRPLPLQETAYTFEFALFSTPARPPVVAERKARLVSAHLDDCFTEEDYRLLDIYGIGWHRQVPKKHVMLPVFTPPDGVPPEPSSQFINAYTAKGGKFIPYGALYAFPRVLPGDEWEHYRKHWLTRESLDAPAFSKNKTWAKLQGLEPSTNSLVYVTYTHKSIRDFLVYHYVQAVKTGKVHGIYLDVSSPNILSTVPSQPYGAHVKAGGLYYPFFAQRQLLKRLYIACREIDPSFMITQHTSKIASVVAGFTGIVAGGESLNVVFRGKSSLKQCQTDINAYVPDYGRVPEYVYLSEFGKGRGINMELLPQIHHGLFNKDVMAAHPALRERYTDSLLSRTLVYDIKLWPAYMDQEILHDVLAVKRQFGWLVDAQYVSPADSSGAFSGSIDPALRVAYYTRSTRNDALLVVSNVAGQTAHQTLRPAHLGNVVAKTLSVAYVSTSSDENLVRIVDGTTIDAALGPGQYAVVVVNPREH